MKKGLIATTVAIAGFLSVGLAAWALERDVWEQHFGGHRPGNVTSKLMTFLDDDHVKTELGLSDQQVQRLRQIIVDTEKSSIKTRADLAVRGIELRELLRPDHPEREAVMKKVQEISNLRGEMMKQHVDALLAAKTVLTPEQQKKIRLFLEKKHAMELWRQPMEHHPGPPGRAPERPGPEPKPPVK